MITDVIKKPRITEKSAQALNGLNKYTFEVSQNANKIDVRRFIEKEYSVKVTSVNILNTSRKQRRRGKSVGYTSSTKKAIVTLAEGQVINDVKGL